MPWNYKSKPCQHYHSGAKCVHGERCAFYHDLSERREPNLALKAQRETARGAATTKMPAPRDKEAAPAGPGIARQKAPEVADMTAFPSLGGAPSEGWNAPKPKAWGVPGGSDKNVLTGNAADLLGSLSLNNTPNSQ